MRTFLYELSRRKVFRMAAIYILASWVIMQALDALLPLIGLGSSSLKFIAILLLIGLPIAAVLAWKYELAPQGIRRTQAIQPDEAVVTHYIHHLEIVILGALLIVAIYFVWSGRLADEPPVIAPPEQPTAASISCETPLMPHPLGGRLPSRCVDREWGSIRSG